MTAFAGIVALAVQPPPAIAALGAALREGLSRHPGEAIATRTTARAVVHYYDLDAWADGPAARDAGPWFLFASGDPAYGEAASRQGGVDLFADRFARDPAAALAGTTGTFALVALDREGAILAADKFGSRPVYWSRQGEVLCFATSFRLLRDTLGEARTVDRRALQETVVAGNPLGDRTLFAEIRLLRPGEWLRAGGGEVALARYHDWSRVPSAPLARDAAVSAVHEAFMRAVRRRSYAPHADAFLSGGLDSRCVVAGLLDAGREVHTFNSSYPGSADHVLGEEIARHFGTRHVTDLRDPVESLRHTLLTFANYARRARAAFPRRDGRPEDAGRLLWSGDGGSLMMGHIYLTADHVRAFADLPVSPALVRARYPGQGRRLVRDSRSARFRDEAHAAIAAEVNVVACPRPDRRLYTFYVLNKQARHLYWNYEQIDRSRVEFVTPFFDSRLIETVMGLPTEWFLRHGFYNDWLGRFGVRADAVPWQVYPGHLPGPHPPRADLRNQWREDWHERRQLCRIYRDGARQVVRDGGRFSREVLAYRRLALYYASFVLGSDCFGYEVRTANKLSAELDRAY